MKTIYVVIDKPSFFGIAYFSNKEAAEIRRDEVRKIVNSPEDIQVEPKTVFDSIEEHNERSISTNPI